MKLAMFREGGRDRLGVVEADTVIDVTAGLPALSADLADWLPGQGTSWRMLALLARSHGAPAAVRRLLPPLRRRRRSWPSAATMPRICGRSPI